MQAYLPAVYGNATVGGQASQAAQFAAWWLYRLGDQRSRMVEDARLTQCAEAHATYLARRTDIAVSMHVGAEGSTPNERVRAVGYQLPAHFLARGNNVESCSYSYDPIDETVDDLMASPLHRDHMRVQGWFSDHTHYGVGNAGAYYVVVSAPRGG